MINGKTCWCQLPLKHTNAPVEDEVSIPFGFSSAYPGMKILEAAASSALPSKGLVRPAEGCLAMDVTG